MFQKEDCFRLGHVSKAHGYKGEVSIFLDVDDPYDYKELESVFVEIDGKLIPFFLEYIRLRNNSYAVVKFELVDTEKQVNLLLRKDLFLPLEVLPETEGNEFYYFEIEGYKVIDEKHGEIGIVMGIIDLSGNPIIQIDANDKEILIPKQNEFIDKVDRENQILYIKAPPGLIEMYLG